MQHVYFGESARIGQHKRELTSPRLEQRTFAELMRRGSKRRRRLPTRMGRVGCDPLQMKGAVLILIALLQRRQPPTSPRRMVRSKSPSWMPEYIVRSLVYTTRYILLLRSPAKSSTERGVASRTALVRKASRAELLLSITLARLPISTQIVQQPLDGILGLCTPPSRLTLLHEKRQTALMLFCAALSLLADRADSQQV